MEKIILRGKKRLLDEMWHSDPHLKTLLRNSGGLHESRQMLFDYLNRTEKHYFSVYSDRHFKDLHILERNNAKECIRVLKNVLRSENEHLTGFSALKALFELCNEEKKTLPEIGEGFLCEFIFLFRGMNGRSGIFSGEPIHPDAGENPAIARSRKLDEYSSKMLSYFRKYPSGTDAALVRKRNALRKKIMKSFGAGEKDWKDYEWHLRRIIKDSKTLSGLVKLSRSELEGVRIAEQNGIPFQITPYYLSLFSMDGRDRADSAIRAQVLPSATYCRNVIENRRKKIDMDFMGEKSTSPVDKITRRYPQILILKPYDSCPQICVYCQRNWEIKEMNKAVQSRESILKAIEWIRRHRTITEVLVTGGDPLTLDNAYISELLRKLSCIGHVERIRIGTRVFATLPFRINGGLLEILERYHVPGKREICLVTHFEHSSEITPDVLDAVTSVRRLGIGVYNQQVFTYYNSRKFETCFLRKMLKISGIDPYYSFNTKGKEETIDFRVPIARIEQERKEEARLLPGMVRTDEPVFNVPRLGKSHLRSWQDHEPIMILANGQRVYRFYPWESRIEMVDDYLYTDVSIYDYLRRLAADGEDIEGYRSIWYYF